MSRRRRPGADTGGPRWAALRLRVFERDGYRCRKCGKAGRLECDHVVPVAQGGAPYDPANLQTLCRGCHILKHTRPVPKERQDWLNRLRGIAAGK